MGMTPKTIFPVVRVNKGRFASPSSSKPLPKLTPKAATPPAPTTLAKSAMPLRPIHAGVLAAIKRLRSTSLARNAGLATQGVQDGANAAFGSAFKLPHGMPGPSGYAPGHNTGPGIMLGQVPAVISRKAGLPVPLAPVTRAPKPPLGAPESTRTYGSSLSALLRATGAAMTAGGTVGYFSENNLRDPQVLVGKGINAVLPGNNGPAYNPAATGPAGIAATTTGIADAPAPTTTPSAPSDDYLSQAWDWLSSSPAHWGPVLGGGALGTIGLMHLAKRRAEANRETEEEQLYKHLFKGAQYRELMKVAEAYPMQAGYLGALVAQGCDELHLQYAVKTGASIEILCDEFDAFDKQAAVAAPRVKQAFLGKLLKPVLGGLGLSASNEAANALQGPVQPQGGWMQTAGDLLGRAGNAAAGSIAAGVGGAGNMLGNTAHAAATTGHKAGLLPKAVPAATGAFTEHMGRGADAGIRDMYNAFTPKGNSGPNSALGGFLDKSVAATSEKMPWAGAVAGAGSYVGQGAAQGIPSAMALGGIGGAVGTAGRAAGQVPSVARLAAMPGAATGLRVGGTAADFAGWNQMDRAQQQAEMASTDQAASGLPAGPSRGKFSPVEPVPGGMGRGPATALPDDSRHQAVATELLDQNRKAMAMQRLAADPNNAALPPQQQQAAMQAELQKMQVEASQAAQRAQQAFAQMPQQSQGPLTVEQTQLMTSAITDGATAIALQRGEDPKALVARLLSDGPDQADLDFVMQGEAGQQIAQMAQARGSLDPVGAAQDWILQTAEQDPASFAMMAFGVPLGLMGLYQTISGQGGLGSLLMTLFGLGGAAYGANQTGLLDLGSLGNTAKGWFNSLMGNNTQSGQNPATSGQQATTDAAGNPLPQPISGQGPAIPSAPQPFDVSGAPAQVQQMLQDHTVTKSEIESLLGQDGNVDPTIEAWSNGLNLDQRRQILGMLDPATKQELAGKANSWQRWAAPSVAQPWLAAMRG